MTVQNIGVLSRRTLLRQAGVAVVASLGAPAVVTAKKSESEPFVGAGDYRYRVHHNWAQLPAKFSWQITHNVAIDKTGCVYVIHRGSNDLPDHPSIFVFDPHGRYLRSFASEFQGGGHGLEVRDEGGQEFLYVTGYQHLRKFVKMDLHGEVVWRKFAPMEAGMYVQESDALAEPVKGRDRFWPTNFAFHPTDGGFYLADGYGAWVIHRYDKDANWLASFGSPGKTDGQFDTPHGLWIDDRAEGEPSVVVADRVNGRLQWFSLAGEHRRTLDGFLLPANVDVAGDLMLVPDLQARITLLDRDNKVVAQLGEDPAWRAEVLKNEYEMRKHPSRWLAGKFIHPHDACFDSQGNIFVAEWVETGRITKLERLPV